MATTTNYSWTTPDNTAYVKDGASAIRTLGSSVDSTLFTALGGAYPGLRLIKKQTIGTAVSSVTVTGAFSATYENYVIKVSGGVGSTSAASIGLQIGSSTTNYALGAAFAPYSTGTPGAYSNSTNTSSFINIGSSGTNFQAFDVNVNAPFLARYTTVSSNYPYTGGAVYYAGILSDTTSHTAFTLTAASGTMTGGTIYVYGYGIS